MSDTPRTDEAAGLPSIDWEVTATNIFEESRKLEREFNAAKAENEAMKKAVQTAADSLDGLDKHLHGNLGMFLLLALEKLQPFLK